MGPRHQVRPVWALLCLGHSRLEISVPPGKGLVVRFPGRVGHPCLHLFDGSAKRPIGHTTRAPNSKSETGELLIRFSWSCSQACRIWPMWWERTLSRSVSLLLPASKSSEVH